jgi:hypothetical protein
MTTHLFALCIDAMDSPGLARFWCGVLGWMLADGLYDGIALLPSDDTGFGSDFVRPRNRRPARTRCTSI